jgi:NADPH2:quinone reductase
MTNRIAANQAIIADPIRPGQLLVREVDDPRPQPHQAVLAVDAFSLNAGEVREALEPAQEWRPGWDVAGTVHTPAADGSGPPAGSPVVGFAGVAGGGWARRVAISAVDLAVRPAGVPVSAAACLPVAGLTALFSLAAGGQLLGKSVLVTGANGGVGQFACQLAKASGALVSATVRDARYVEQLRGLGVREVIVGEQPLPRRFDLILECVGGTSLARSMANIEFGGCCVLFGNASEEPTTLQARDFYLPGNVSLHGFFLGTALQRQPAGPGLDQLLELVSTGALAVPVSHEASWYELSSAARQFHDREFAGKVVMHID